MCACACARGSPRAAAAARHSHAAAHQHAPPRGLQPTACARTLGVPSAFLRAKSKTGTSSPSSPAPPWLPLRAHGEVCACACAPGDMHGCSPGCSTQVWMQHGAGMQPHTQAPTLPPPAWHQAAAPPPRGTGAARPPAWHARVPPACWPVAAHPCHCSWAQGPRRSACRDGAMVRWRRWSDGGGYGFDGARGASWWARGGPVGAGRTAMGLWRRRNTHPHSLSSSASSAVRLGSSTPQWRPCGSASRPASRAGWVLPRG